MTKSYVTMEQKQCPICGTIEDTGSILMDKRLKERFDNYTITGLNYCKECQDKKDKGYLALIVAKETNEIKNKGSIEFNEANRTGEIIHIKREAFNKLFKQKVKADLDFMFCSEELRDKLKQLIK